MKSIAMTGLLVVSMAISAGEVSYPEGYRHWNHVKSMVILEGHPLADPFQGIHHVYANGKALEGLKNGAFPKGSVLVFDLLKEVQGEHAITEGERKFIGVMQRDPERFKETGGWGFEAFAGNTRERMVKDGGKSCYGCHVQEKDRVFSQWRD